MIIVIIFMMTVTNIVLIDKRCKNNSHNNYRYDKNENADERNYWCNNNNFKSDYVSEQERNDHYHNNSNHDNK